MSYTPGIYLQRRLIFLGDSLLNCTGADPVVLGGHYIPTKVYEQCRINTTLGLHTFASSGNTLANIITTWSTYSAMIRPDDIVVINAVTNDLGTNLRTAAQAYTDLTTICGYISAIGAISVVCTMPARNKVGDPADIETQRTNYNTSVRTNSPVVCDYVCDVGLDPMFDTQADTANATNYNTDLLHLDVAGSDKFAFLIIGTVSTILAETTVAAPLALWYNSLTTKPSSTLLTHLNTLVTSLYTNAIWDELDLFHVIGGLETDEQRLKPLKSTAATNSLTDFTNVNSATLDTTGVTGNGSTSYLNLNWNPSTNKNKFAQDSSSLSIYSRTDNASVGWDAGHSQLGILLDNSGNLQYRVNDATLDNVANTNSSGFYHLVRTASNAKSVYRNGSQIGSTVTTASGAINNFSLFIGCRNNGGTPLNFTDRNYSMISAGSSAMNQSTFYTNIQTYMTSRGINV